jgi:alpha-1,3/alpha-1,6-mannosyltransferase
VHPDLGLGGAERLVVDAAVWLQAAGHAVTIFTTYHDASRCFAPTRDGTLKVEVHGDILRYPGLSRLRVPLALCRMSALAGSLRNRRNDFDLIFCDLIAHSIPALRAALQKPVVFFCHFPDLLLTPPSGALYRAYRIPIDLLEARGMRAADAILANSNFTRTKCEEAFPDTPASPQVLDPGLDVGFYEGIAPLEDGPVIRLLSVNRFEAPKNLTLAVETLAGLRSLIHSDLFKRVRLVMAGGFDPRLPECAATLDSLKKLASRLNIETQVEFVPNPTDRERKQLLADCRCLLYTPTREHFGLVPIEAMSAARPVIAVNHGGPLETVLDGRTGALRPPTGDAFASAAKPYVEDFALARAHGEAARAHVKSNFSLDRFGSQLETALLKVLGHDRCTGLNS